MAVTVEDFLAHSSLILKEKVTISLSELSLFIINQNIQNGFDSLQADLKKYPYIIDGRSKLVAINEFYITLIEILLMIAITILRNPDDCSEDDKDSLFEIFARLIISIYQQAYFIYLQRQAIDPFKHLDNQQWTGLQTELLDIFKIQIKNLLSREELLINFERITITHYSYDYIIHGYDTCSVQFKIAYATFMHLAVALYNTQKHGEEKIRSLKKVMHKLYRADDVKDVVNNTINNCFNSKPSWQTKLYTVDKSLSKTSYSIISAMNIGGFFVSPILGALTNIGILGYIGYKSYHQKYFKFNFIMRLMQATLNDLYLVKDNKHIVFDLDKFRLGIEIVLTTMKKTKQVPDTNIIMECMTMRQLQIEAKLDMVAPSVDCIQRIAKHYRYRKMKQAQRNDAREQQQLNSIFFLPDVKPSPIKQKKLTKNSHSRVISHKASMVSRVASNSTSNDTYQNSLIRIISNSQGSCAAFYFPRKTFDCIPEDLQQAAQFIYSQPFSDAYIDGQFDRILRPRGQFGGFKKLLDRDAFELKAFRRSGKRLIFIRDSLVTNRAIIERAPDLPQSCPAYIFEGEIISH